MLPTGISDQRLNVLFVGHEASRTGAPIGFLHLMRWLTERGLVNGAVWLRNGGPLVDEHQTIGPVVVGADPERLLERAAGTEFHLAYLNTATLGMQAEALKSCGLPVVCHVHEMDFELSLTSAANRERLRRTVDCFLACSEATRDSLVRCLEISRESVIVVPECVDVERVLRAAAVPPQVSHRALGRKLVAGMGVVSWRKGVDLFLRVCADLVANDPSWHGLWIGDLPVGTDTARVQHDLRILGLADRITFTGSLANPHAQLAQADVFCLTSREDPYPLAMIEAAILGKPVVGFAGAGGVEEFCRSAGGAIVGYGDTGAMAAMVRRMAGGEPFPGRGLAAARALCHPDVVGSRIVEVIRATALTQPVVWTEEMAALVTPSGGVSAGVAVTAEFGSERLQADWEVAARGEAEIHFTFTEPFGGPLSVTVEPVSRNLVLEDFEISWTSVTGMEARVLPTVKSTGRAVQLRRGTVPFWILFEGRGRVILDVGSVPPLRTLTVRWRSDTDIKQGVRAALGNTAPVKRGIFDLFPVGLRGSSGEASVVRTKMLETPGPDTVSALWH